MTEPTPRLVMAAVWIPAEGDNEATKPVAEALRSLGAVKGHGAVVSFGENPPEELLGELRWLQLEEASKRP